MGETIQVLRILVAFCFFFVLMAVFVWKVTSLRRNNRKALGNSACYFSTEGAMAGDELKAEFSRLVTAIAYYNLAQRKKKCPAAHHLGVAEDMKDAFLQAVEEVRLANKNNSHTGIGAVLDRMKQIREKYETP